MPEPRRTGAAASSETLDTAGGPSGRSTLGSGRRILMPIVVTVGLAVFLAAAWLTVGAVVGPGLALVAIGLGAALVVGGLNNPVLAMMLLLTTLFLRPALAPEALPVELFILAFCGVLGAAALAVARGAGRLPKLGSIELAMGLYVMWNIGSAIAPHPYSTIDPRTGELNSVYHFILTGVLLPIALYIVGRLLFDRESAVRTVLSAIVVFTAYSAAVSILQFHAPGLVWPRYIVEQPPDHGWAERAIGVFGQPVANGLLLVVGFAVVVHLAHRPLVPRWQRMALALLAVASVYGIYLTYTRAVWLTFVVLLVLCAVLLPRSRTSSVATIGAVVVVIVLNRTRFTSADRTVGGVGSPDEVGDRLNMIATAWWAVQERPLAGWGIGRFSRVNTYHHQQWPGVDWIRGYSISSHFNDLGIAAELGLVGLGLWFTIVFLVIRRLVRAVATLPREGLCGRDLAAIALTAFVIWIVTGLTADLRFFDFANALVLLLAGIAVGVADRHVMASQPDVPSGRDLAGSVERHPPAEVRS